MRTRTAPPRRVAPKAPNCTHINMDRIYGRDQNCYVCGREPSIGFLYVCRQDDKVVPDTPLEGPRVAHGTLDDHYHDEGLKSDLRRELEGIGLSQYVISAAERGEYTAQQLKKLKLQKLELKQAISDIPQTCTFRACHTCRPYYRDRVYTSFHAVLRNELPPLTAFDVSMLPTKSASILKTIGLLTTPTDNDPSPVPLHQPSSTDSTTLTTSRLSVLTFRTSQTDISELRRMHRPRKRFYNLGARNSASIADSLSKQLSWRAGLKTAIQGIFKSTRESSSEGSTITLPVSRMSTVRHGIKELGDLDLGSLRHVKRQKDRMDMRNEVGIEATEGVRRHSVDDGSESASELTVYSRASEAGSEVEVEGGVALTEEAVETHTPDILNVEDVHADIEPIMTQV
ncbi:uncharacterized protein BDR25DRAFT_372597 [Lindgomyces ingoldianus]|uniref:Uncharacterized protein n=1 Tax=Lindgomyces ingoldianus TaxID=673940 RepID=A0ACB6QP01_9PLEO|nr:uncharacterized protein BDR25DRAFT_372597 [Lindgomyces ingoldianus]KAF2468754.1 hypothetical protein BDR25DRAFT_372597 [Lindgomyces ingoldianus]